MKKILILFFIFVFFSGCAQQPLVKRAQASLGTIVEITVADEDKPRQSINRAIKKAFAEINRVEDLLSKFNPESEISRINANANLQPTKVSAETITLLKRSIEFSQLSDGAFDITLGPLLEVWGFVEKEKKQLPNLKQIKQALKKVGFQHINIHPEEQSVSLARPGMRLDLGGIAKGYAVDKAIAVLKQEGIKNALVNAGGDIYCLGKRNRSEKWQVAVQHPRHPNTTLTVLKLQDQAVATSGDYQKYIDLSGKRYSHIINPKTGYPADQTAGVTVLAKDCVSADALSTSIFVLGEDAGLGLVNRLSDVEAIVCGLHSHNGHKLTIQLSRGLRDVLIAKP